MAYSISPLPQLLISVRSASEAEIALAGGADIIDVKEPASGILGAAPLEITHNIVKTISGKRPVSATIGDIPLSQSLPASEATAATGVDYVKIGAFPGGDPTAGLMALKSLADKGVQLILVIFADMEPDLRLIGMAANAGFKGVMFDTARKKFGTLRDSMSNEQLSTFLRQAKEAGLMAGLAGSLTLSDIPPLTALQPDVLGFRGAACVKAAREGELTKSAVTTLQNAIKRPPFLEEKEAAAV
ncbi:MAG: (5-formylfuran-3-yl)methyl phosphate synthase [Alphaproteobacteria bacterium]